MKDVDIWVLITMAVNVSSSLLLVGNVSVSMADPGLELVLC